MEWPYTSASKIPTLKPACAVAIAIFTVKEDLPTPPFPDAIPMTRVSESGCANGINASRPPRINFFTSLRCVSFITPKSIFTSVIPSMLETAFTTSLRKRSFIGQPAIVKRILIEAIPESTLTDSTIPNSVIGRCSSGSMTVESADVIRSLVITELNPFIKYLDQVELLSSVLSLPLQVNQLDRQHW